MNFPDDHFFCRWRIEAWYWWESARYSSVYVDLFRICAYIYFSHLLSFKPSKCLAKQHGMREKDELMKCEPEHTEKKHKLSKNLIRIHTCTSHRTQLFWLFHNTEYRSELACDSLFRSGGWQHVLSLTLHTKSYRTVLSINRKKNFRIFGIVCKWIKLVLIFSCNLKMNEKKTWEFEQ